MFTSICLRLPLVLTLLILAGGAHATVSGNKDATQEASIKLAVLKQTRDTLIEQIAQLRRDTENGDKYQLQDRASKDFRDRVIGDDLSDFVVTSDDRNHINIISSTFDRAAAQLNVEQSQTQLDALDALLEVAEKHRRLILEYWQSVSQVQREFRLWKRALELDRLPEETAHNQDVLDAEKRLKMAITFGTPANDGWLSEMHAYLSAMIADRIALAKRFGANYGNTDPHLNNLVSTAPPTPCSNDNDPNCARVAIAIDPKTVLPQPKLKHPTPNPDDYYPSHSKRSGEEGTVVILIKVDERGHQHSSEVIASSGSDSLDDAALTFSKALQFEPGHINGKPVSSATRLPITFRLNN